MLKWKKHVFSTIDDGDEDLTDILAGMAGKNRVIKFISCDIDVDVFLRVYRDAEQIVDYDCNLLQTYAPILPMDLPLAEGQLCKAGFLNSSGAGITPTIAIGYEETG